MPSLCRVMGGFLYFGGGFLYDTYPDVSWYMNGTHQDTPHDTSRYIKIHQDTCIS